MEIQVSSTSVTRIFDHCDKKELLTNREVPDLDCYYVGTHLSKEKLIGRDCSVEYQQIQMFLNKDIDVLYNTHKVNSDSLWNRVRRFKI